MRKIKINYDAKRKIEKKSSKGNGSDSIDGTIAIFHLTYFAKMTARVPSVLQ